MSDSPRWHLDGLPGTTGIVEVMLYADHVAAVEEALQRGAGLAAMAWSSHMQRAVAAAEQRVMKSATDRDPDFTTSGYLRGKRDGRREGIKAARDAVAALTQQHFMFMPTFVFRTDALAAIDALLKEKP